MELTHGVVDDGWDDTHDDDGPAGHDADQIRVVGLHQFIAVDETGADPLLGDEHGALIPEGGDVMVYGDGGAGKTTLLFDLALHLAAGKAWLDVPVRRPVRVLIVENEGPRPLLRQKLRRKLDSWTGPPVDDRVCVLEEPWGKLTLADADWRTKVAENVAELEIDVLIAGPLTRLGMDTAGTLQETAAFMRLCANVRELSKRPLTFVLAHHENRAGTVSGAWEGAGDTLLHVQAAGNGHTIVYIQKARWASRLHHATLKLAWTEGEGFVLEGDRDLLGDVRRLLADGNWRTAKQISAPETDGGIGASEKTVRELLTQNSDLIECRTGDAAKALGRHPSATLYGVSQPLNSPDSPGEFLEGVEGGELLSPPFKGLSNPDTPSPPADLPESSAQLTPGDDPIDADAELARIQSKFGDLG